MQTTLPPIEHKDAYNVAVEREINAWMSEALFMPIQIILGNAGVQLRRAYQAISYDEFGRDNAEVTAIEAGLKDGRIFYAQGTFSGQFSSAITRELRAAGATFNATARTFTINEAVIPMELRGILQAAAERSASLSTSVLDVLRIIEENVAAANVGLTLARALAPVVKDMGRQLIATTTTISPDNIGLAPSLDEGTTARLEEELTNNLNLSIKGWAQQRIPELRRRVQENAFQFGGRTDRLAKIIEAEFGVAKRKAEFLANHETGLLVSKYRSAKYEQLGITDYIWSTSHDKDVRPAHARLDGKRFTFAAGALVTEPGQPARYCNPGEDYNCRCVPRPIVNLAELAA